ncbi:hypothetical protein U1Q18_014112 [Sarracenia purpurea var. burkii]
MASKFPSIDREGDGVSAMGVSQSGVKDTIAMGDTQSPKVMDSARVLNLTGSPQTRANLTPLDKASPGVAISCAALGVSQLSSARQEEVVQGARSRASLSTGKQACEVSSDESSQEGADGEEEEGYEMEAIQVKERIVGQGNNLLAFGHVTEKCSAKKSEEEIEGWIKVGKGKGKASEVQSGGKFPESPSTSGCQREEGTSLQVAEVGEKEASMEEESAQEVYPVQVAKDLGVKEVQIAAHCLAVNHSDSEEGMLGSEGDTPGSPSGLLLLYISFVVALWHIWKGLKIICGLKCAAEDIQAERDVMPIGCGAAGLYSNG